METGTTKSIDDIPFYTTVEDGADGPSEHFSQEDVNFARDPVNYHLKAYRRHGQIYRVSFRNRTWVAIGGLEANDYAWRNSDAWSYRKAMAGFGEELGHVHVTTMDGQPHRLKRLSLKPGFRMDAVMRHLPVMSEAVAGQLRQYDGKEVDLYDFLMASIIRGSSKTMVQSELDAEMVREMATFEEKFMYGLNLGSARHEFFARQHYLDTKGKVFKFLRELIEAREGADAPDDNLTALICDRPEAAGEYSMEEKSYDAYLLLVAGAENTTKLITWIIQYLHANPEWTEELRAELRDWRPEALRMGMADFPKLKATIMEGERMQPGAFFHIRVAARDIDLLGYRIPQNTPVLHIQALCHFLEEIYHDPFTFRPQRWLDGKFPKKAHGTFGGGTHICLGMNVTRLHAPVILGNLLKDFHVDLRFVPDFSDRLDLGGAFHRVPLPAVFRKRG